MGPSQATSGYGTIFACDVTGGTTYVQLAEVLDIAGPDGKFNSIDVSNMGSPGNTEEYILGMLAPGSVKLKCNFLPGDATQQSAIAAWQSRQKCGFQITFTDAASHKVSFKGYYMSIAPGATVKDKLAVDIEVKVTGVLTYPT